MPKVIPNHNKVEQDKDEEHYLFVQGETHLHCSTCGQEVELLQCKCGKYGPRAYIEAHLEDRKAKGTPAALATHKLVEVTVPSVTVPTEPDGETYEAVNGARRKVARRGIPTAPYSEDVPAKPKRKR